MKSKAKKAQAAAPGGGAVYFFGLIGAAVYYLQQAHGFWAVILAFLKAVVWPALLVHDVLKFIG
jgi:hypothetical protein